VTRNQLPPLARQALDRDYLSRDINDLFTGLKSRANSLAMLMCEGKVLLANAAGAALDLKPLSEVPEGAFLAYLGKTDHDLTTVAKGSAICLAVITKQQADLIEPDSSRWVSLRASGAGLSDLDAGIFTQGLALNNWHQTHSYCPRCGGETSVEKAGWVRRCKKDDIELFPRTDPAVIVSIIDESDRILLGSQGVWEQNRWSVLAGFVEPGESLESAVIREMKEESGLEVSKPEYIYSQSWPYPYSLMLGFTAKARSSQQLTPDGEEIVRLRWFSRQEITDEAKELLLPGRASISRAMIELWYGKEIFSASETLANGKQ
jgi:NAD+ diphosphatase